MNQLQRQFCKIAKNSVFAISFLLASTALAVDLKEVEALLKGDGLIGLVHGADHKRGSYVLSYNTPGNFFDRIELSLIPANQAAGASLLDLTRGDKVIVQGALEVNRGQPHIFYSNLKILSPYVIDIPHPAGEFTPQTDLPKELMEKDEEIFLVHAISPDGQVLVCEYGDAIVPVVVRDTQYTKNLFRGDYIKLRYKVREEPNSPNNLTLDT